MLRLTLRLALSMAIGGAAVAFFGYQEYTVSSGASEIPVHCELRDLETGSELPDNHLEIGEHWAIFSTWVGSGEYNSDQLDYIYYPIVSEESPYNQAWDNLLARYGDNEIPESEYPSLKSLAVLVKTKKYKREGAIPQEWEKVGSVTGLVINDIESLGPEEKRLLLQSYPELSLQNVLILEEDREPKSVITAVGTILLGGVLIVAGSGVFVRSRQG
jgi:hypothetical protein